jgi:lipopolysaccharide export system permease protein
MVSLLFLDMQFLWVYADELIGKGLSPWVVGELMLYASARLVNLALPLAILMSSIMTLGALAEHNELTAIKSSGHGLQRILRPLALTMVGIAFGAFLFANFAWPVANLKFRTLLYSVSRKKPTMNLQDGVFYNGIDGHAIRAAHVDDATGNLEDVWVYRHGQGREGATMVIRAESGRMTHSGGGRYLVLDLRDGLSYEEVPEKAMRRQQRNLPHLITHFDRQRVWIDLSSLNFAKADEQLFKRAYEMMSLGQLNLAIDSLSEQRAAAARTLVAYGNRSLVVQPDGASEKNLAGPFNGDGDLTGAAARESTSVSARADWLVRLGASAERRVFDGAREMLRTSQQQAANQKAEQASRSTLINRHAIEWHRKIFLATSCILLFFIGAPLGAIIRKGGLGLPTVVAILLFVTYYVITIVGERMVRSGALEPAIGMWMGTVVMLPAAIGLTWWASREARATGAVWKATGRWIVARIPRGRTSKSQAS